MAAGRRSSALRRLCVSDEMRRNATGSQLSPLCIPVGLITTSFSVLQPLRHHCTLLRQNALAKKMAFLNWNCVADSFGSAPLTVARPLCSRVFGRTRRLPVWVERIFCGPAFISGTERRSTNNWGISAESLPRRKDSYGALIFPCSFLFLRFSSLSCSNPSGHPRGHHVQREVGNWKLKQWLSFTERRLSGLSCLNSDIKVEQAPPPHFHSLSSLKWHERLK